MSLRLAETVECSKIPGRFEESFSDDSNKVIQGPGKKGVFIDTFVTVCPLGYC